MKGKGKPLGNSWKKLIGEALMKEAGRIGREKAKALDKPGTGTVVIRVPVTFFVEFGRKGKRLARDGKVRCSCVVTEDVCVCYGQCDFPDCCDDGPIFTEG